MLVKDFIKTFEVLGYDDETELDFGAYDENGDWYNFNYIVDDEDRLMNSDINAIAITTEPSEEYIQSRLKTRYDKDRLMDRICESINEILTSDDY